MFSRRSKAFLAKTNPGGVLPTIEFNPDSLAAPSPEWSEWREYFERHVGEVPTVMRKMIDRSPDAPLAMTVPAQFPVLFDETFRPDPRWKPAPPRLTTPRELHARLEELHRRYGSRWGIRDMNSTKQVPRHFRTPTDDELRARYSKRQAAE